MQRLYIKAMNENALKVIIGSDKNKVKELKCEKKCVCSW